MKNNINTITKAFILNERYIPDCNSSLQALDEIISSIKPRNKKDAGRMQIAKEQVNNLKRHFKNLNEEINLLKEKISVIEEEQTKGQNSKLDKARK